MNPEHSVIAVATPGGPPAVTPTARLADLDDAPDPIASARHADREPPTPTLDVVVPVFNEEECLPELIRRLGSLRERLSAEGIALRVIAVDDGSADRSGDLLAAAADREPWVQPVWLARNFGHQAAVTAGLDASRGTWCAVIDADLQDPPELIHDMLHQLRDSDAQVVFGQRLKRHGESSFKIRTAQAFYRMMRRGSGLDIPLDAGDFRVMDAAVVEDLCRLREHHRLLRAMVPWLGHRAEAFTYEREERFAGRTKYPLRSMVKLASHAVFSFSTAPIRIVQALGIALCIAGTIGGSGLTAAALAGVEIPTAVWVLEAMTVQTGLIILAIGMIGGYVFRIQDEVKHRPLYVRRAVTTPRERPEPPPLEHAP